MARRKCFSASRAMPMCCSRSPIIQWKNGSAGVAWSASRLVGGRRLGLAHRLGGAGEQVVGRGRGRHCSDGVRPGRDRLLPAAEPPQRFAPLLARDDQVGPLGQGLIEARERLLVAAQAVQDRAAIVEARGPCPVLAGARRRRRGGRRPPSVLPARYSSQASFGRASLFANSPRSLAAWRCRLPGGDVPAVGRAEPGDRDSRAPAPARRAPGCPGRRGRRRTRDGAPSRCARSRRSTAARRRQTPSPPARMRPDAFRSKRWNERSLARSSFTVVRARNVVIAAAAERHQHRDELVDVPDRPEARHEHGRAASSSGQVSGVVLRRATAARRSAGLPKPK